MFYNQLLQPIARIGATASSRGTVVSSPVALHTKGAWVELSSATPCHAHAIGLMLRKLTIAPRILLDIGIGAAGSEVVVLDNISFGKSVRSPAYIILPLHIREGERVALRAQASIASQDTVVSAHLLAGSDLVAKGVGRLSTLGADTATTAGVTVTSNASAHTKGAWAEISSSSPRDFRGFWVSTMDTASPPIGNMFMLIDIGIGAAGSEIVIIPDLFYRYINTSGFGFSFRYFPVPIKAGTRIAARMQAETAGAQQAGVIIIGEG